jgi:hypothetical protein
MLGWLWIVLLAGLAGCLADFAGSLCWLAGFAGNFF